MRIMDTSPIEVSLLSSLSQISEAEWDACACSDATPGRPADPFTTYRFLKALEDSGSVGPGTGWQPRYLTVHHGGQIVAVAPLYAKGHSQGEYIFDHNWAHAFESAGGRYYPKLQIAVPFTPATGRRLLVHPGFEEIGQAALIQGAVQVAAENELSSLHITFCTEDEADAAREMGLMVRSSQQFHWQNKGYDGFDGFLAELSSRKRKNIRKERKQANAFGGRIHELTGQDIKPEHWDAFWEFYQDTGARKWGMPYLTRDFFDRVHETMRDDVLLILAERDGRWVAGALNFIGRDVLYGRYWGCSEHHPCLHFELCYYRAIEFAINAGMKRVEAGAQGEHKLARGYLPTQTYSIHWIAERGFAEAVSRYIEEERGVVVEEIEALTDFGPFKTGSLEEENE
jgi:predicted N-acyltransferase